MGCRRSLGLAPPVTKTTTSRLGVEICNAVHPISSTLPSMASEVSPSTSSELLICPVGRHTTIFVVGVATTSVSRHQKPRLGSASL
ncbi:hypothetical protein TIFTF001_016546 [Ficus carica]|uniref:Uncharacterized protein n=1 Tax=Ficus carica TaxID=3494 RepID=A0AA88A7S0_FICCA|nr:hypothetical protein TIFTF001_016546 [Ficus carica]